MHRFFRWVTAVVATVIAFALPAWICGALLFPLMLKDSSIRWGLASAVGLALAALASLWGKDFAAEPQEEKAERRASGHVVQALGARSVAIGGANHGSVSTGNATPPKSAASASAPAAAAAPAERPRRPQSVTAPNVDTVSASAERSIAVGGDNTGLLSTGDESDSVVS